MAVTMARTTMVPPAVLLPDVLPTERLNARAMPVRQLRDELRRIPTARNVITVVMALVQTFGVVIAAAVVDRWWGWVLAFLLMGRGHCLLNILGHEAAHRLLFPNRRVNDFVGRWLLAYPTFQAFTAYRRVHFAHHRDELGPEEPDTALYRGYPIAADSWHRKLRRDLFAISAYKNFKALGHSLRNRSVEAWQIVAVQAVLLGSSIAFGAPPTSSARRRSPASAWCRTTRAGTSPTTSTWACRGATCRSCTPSWCAPVGSCPTSSTRRTGRSGRPARPASRCAEPRTGTPPIPALPTVTARPTVHLMILR
jgi:hypothetical protein